MSIPPYSLGYPPDGFYLGQTKLTMRNNLDGTFLTLGTDHINNNGQPNANPAGYHNVVHWTIQGADPTTIIGVTQEYTKTDANAIQQKWLKTTGGNAYQQTTMLDGDFATFAQEPGWSYLPGGLIIQYGSTNGVTNGQDIPYAFTFPNNVFSLVVTRHQANTGSTWGYSTKTTANFTFSTSGGSATVDWVAIGN